jgi:hypothetical protein
MNLSAQQKAQLQTVGIDHAIEGKVPVIPLNETGERVTKDDAATGALLQHILDDIAYAEQDEKFCGFQHQAFCDADGKILYVLLVACELNGDQPVRRV